MKKMTEITESLRLFLEYDVKSGGNDVRNLMKNGKICIINSNYVSVQGQKMFIKSISASERIELAFA